MMTVNPILEGTREMLRFPVRVLNQPLVKEGFKNLAGSVTFAFGLWELYDAVQVFRSRQITVETTSEDSWLRTVDKVAVCARISLILSAAVSRPGVFVISSLAGRLFSPVQLDRFGPNTIFAVNPWHPRHVVSIAAVCLALPSVVQSTYYGLEWLRGRIRPLGEEKKRESTRWAIDSKIRWMAVFNTITGRPTLHVGNQLSRWLLRSGI